MAPLRYCPQNLTVRLSHGKSFAHIAAPPCCGHGPTVSPKIQADLSHEYHVSTSLCRRCALRFPLRHERPILPTAWNENA